jgi:predicted O-methyltransferase YrrM
MAYEFTQDWFSWNEPTWKELFKELTPRKKFLEIGCFEGRATVWLIENALEDGGYILSVDTFEGGFEHSPDTMKGVATRFKQNVEEAIKNKPQVRADLMIKTSTQAMAILMENASQYDFIYIDGSHSGPDVLSDAIMAYHLCRVGGMIAFDDYLWGNQADLIERPKVAIDCFVNIFAKKVKIVCLGSQVWVQKIA